MIAGLGTLVPQRGQEVSDRDAIRHALLQFLAIKGTIQITTIFTVLGPGVALTRGLWKLNGTGLDGKSIEMTSQDVEVLRQQPNGDWLLAVDHPFGAD